MSDNPYFDDIKRQAPPDPFAGLRGSADVMGVDRHEALRNILKTIPALSLVAAQPNYSQLASTAGEMLAPQIMPAAATPPTESIQPPPQAAPIEPTPRAEGLSQPLPQAPPAAPPLHTGTAGLVNLHPDVENLLRARAAAYGEDADTMVRLARAEGGGFNEVSPAGARGPMQLMPDTAKSLGVDPHNWRQNVEGGAKYFRQLLDQFGGNYRLAAAAYNAGPNREGVRYYASSGDPSHLPAETQAYIKKIFGGF